MSFNVKITYSANTVCNAASNASCKLTNHIDLNREFYNIKLKKQTLANTAWLYIAQLGTAITGNTENFLSGSNVDSYNSYFTLTFEFPE